MPRVVSYLARHVRRGGVRWGVRDRKRVVNVMKRWVWLVAIGVVVTIVGAGGYFYWRLDSAGDLTGWGAKGDAMAPFAALLAALALLATASSVLLQSGELALQREEMKRSSEAQKEIAVGQVEANRLALKTVEVQRNVALSQMSSDREIAAAQIDAQSNVSRQATRARLLQAKVDLLRWPKSEENAYARGHWHNQIDKALGELDVELPPPDFRDGVASDDEKALREIPIP